MRTFKDVARVWETSLRMDGDEFEQCMRVWSMELEEAKLALERERVEIDKQYAAMHTSASKEQEPTIPC